MTTLRNMLTARILCSVAAILFSALPAMAQEECTSCEEVYGLEETIAKSDLIMLAESEPFTGFRPGGPATITAKVIEVLKGTYPEKTIQLRSWTGMCPYGFVFQHKQEVIFIVKNLAGEYVRLKDGCGAENLKFENGLVDGKHTLEEFKKIFIK